ncbi:CDGSH iron-sulfur domain-containing protein [Polynucleobacter meluiroseus]|uniref:CDGSH iron-sulfur domain-containing protein n=1 Tax=Polynucleobacter meluiroseus TaxID=1938814 RepID=UPI003AF39628
MEEGEVFFWCTCGKSQKQPFCDGSHRASGKNPLRVVALETKVALFCNCKQTSSPPFCDGSHLNQAKK